VPILYDFDWAFNYSSFTFVENMVGLRPHDPPRLRLLIREDATYGPPAKDNWALVGLLFGGWHGAIGSV
jgi:hypothetical protein